MWELANKIHLPYTIKDNERHIELPLLGVVFECEEHSIDEPDESQYGQDDESNTVVEVIDVQHLRRVKQLQYDQYRFQFFIYFEAKPAFNKLGPVSQRPTKFRR